MSGVMDRCRGALRATADIIDEVAALPAVATLDWTDRAASALGRLATPSRSCLVICSVDEHGAVVHHEATGVATRRGDGAGSEEHSVELTLRSRGERLDHLGFRLTPGHLAEGVSDSLDRLLQTADWRSRGLGRLWAGVPAGEVLVGIQSLTESDPWRVLIAMVGVGTAESPEARDLRVLTLGAVLDPVIRRARLATGATRTTAARWLTQREQQVLDELILGKSVRQIAEKIGRSPHTVHDHVKSLHRKLNASSRGELVARALGYLGDDRLEARASTTDADGRLAEIKTTHRDAATLRRPAPSTPSGAQSSGVHAPGAARQDGIDAPLIDASTRTESARSLEDSPG